MAFSHALVTEAELNAMAGELVDVTGWVEANKQAWANQASGYLCALCKYDLITNVATLTANGKQIFAEYIARYAAVCAINYNPIGFVSPTGGSTTQVENMLNVHLARMNKIEKILTSEDIRNFLKI